MYINSYRTPVIIRFPQRPCSDTRTKRAAFPDGDGTAIPDGDVTAIPDGYATALSAGDVTAIPGGDVAVIPGGDKTVMKTVTLWCLQTGTFR